MAIADKNAIQMKKKLEFWQLENIITSRYNSLKRKKKSGRNEYIFNTNKSAIHFMAR